MSFGGRRVSVWTCILNHFFTSLSIYFCFKSASSYESYIISNDNMINKLLISSAWKEAAVTQFQTIFQYFYILVYMCEIYTGCILRCDTLNTDRSVSTYLCHGYGNPEGNSLLSPPEAPQLSQILSDPEVRNFTHLPIFKVNTDEEARQCDEHTCLSYLYFA